MSCARTLVLGGDWVARVADFGLAEEEQVLRQSLQAAIYSEEDAEGKLVKGRFVSGTLKAPSRALHVSSRPVTYQYNDLESFGIVQSFTCVVIRFIFS